LPNAKPTLSSPREHGATSVVTSVEMTGPASVGTTPAPLEDPRDVQCERRAMGDRGGVIAEDELLTDVVVVALRWPRIALPIPNEDEVARLEEAGANECAHQSRMRGTRCSNIDVSGVRWRGDGEGRPTDGVVRGVAIRDGDRHPSDVSMNSMSETGWLPTMGVPPGT
jgi:hypothetical protein